MTEETKTRKQPQKKEPSWEYDSSLRMVIRKGDLWKPDKDLKMVFQETRQKKKETRE